MPKKHIRTNIVVSQKSAIIMFLRWHYPNQVMGQGIQPTLSKLMQAPLLFSQITIFLIVFTLISN